MRPQAGLRLQRCGPRSPLARALLLTIGRESFPSGGGSGAATPTERGHDREHHGKHGLAAALGAGVLCRRPLGSIFELGQSPQFAERRSACGPQVRPRARAEILAPGPSCVSDTLLTQTVSCGPLRRSRREFITISQIHRPHTDIRVRVSPPQPRSRSARAPLRPVIRPISPIVVWGPRLRTHTMRPSSMLTYPAAWTSTARRPSRPRRAAS